MIEGEIITQLQELIQRLIPVSFTGKVISVDEAEGTAVVLFDEIEHDVKLKSIVDEKQYGIFIIPEIDSDVFCVPEGLDQERYFVAGVNTISKIITKMQNLDFVMDNEAKSLKITNGNTTFELTDTLSQFNEGSNGGLIKVSELVSKINDLENDINSLKQALFTWIPTPQDGGAGFKAAAGTWAGQQFVNTQVAEIENDKVKH